MLKIRFFGVGDGDSILIEFPDGQLGLVDSCISSITKKPAAWEFVQNKHLAFCCMTHPHRDHYAGLLDILKSPNICVDQFWYALSDLDVVIDAYNWTLVPDGDHSASSWKREHRTGALIDLFDWVYSNDDGNFAKEFTDVHYRSFGDVEIVIFGPDSLCWKEYKERLIEKRKAGELLRRDYENAISMVLLVKYGEHLVWLLSDILEQPMLNLSARQSEFLPDEVRKWGTKASVIKIPHHGATNAWFREISEEFTTCDKKNVVVCSANGGKAHPNPQVWEYWHGTGKQVHGTWNNSNEVRVENPSSWALDSIDDIAFRPKEPRDVVVSIDADGTISVEELPIQVDQ